MYYDFLDYLRRMLKSMILVAAMGLYRKIGYKIIPNYGQYQNMPNSICMKKEL